MKTIEKVRLISHNFGAILASIGLYLLFLSLLIEPTLLSNPIQRICYIIYLSLYPIFIGLIIVEDIILMAKYKTFVEGLNIGRKPIQKEKR